jgi:hypothetical protein
VYALVEEAVKAEAARSGGCPYSTTSVASLSREIKSWVAPDRPIRGSELLYNGAIGMT